MVLSDKTILSLKQLVINLSKEDKDLLLEKYDIDTETIELLFEIVQIRESLRKKISPKVLFDDSFNVLQKYLMLDGYKIDDRELIKIEPMIAGVLSFRDDLSDLIKNSDLNRKNEFIELIEESEKDFIQEDYIACLTKSRVLLENIVKDLVGIDDIRWGDALSRLRTDNDFIDQEEENVLSSFYTFVSDGSHQILGFSDEEYARYARNLIISACYYLMKKHCN